MRPDRIALFFGFFLGFSVRDPSLAGDISAPHSPPSGINAKDWSSIRMAYEHARLTVQPEADGYRARNYFQQWTTHFDGQGFTVRPDSGDWTWGLKLKSYGFPGHEQAAE